MKHVAAAVLPPELTSAPGLMFVIAAALGLFVLKMSQFDPAQNRFDPFRT
jgi:hypothetical protein